MCAEQVQTPVPPELDATDQIDALSPAGSCDELLRGISRQALDSPVLHTAAAAEVGAALYSALPREGVALDAVLAELMRSAGRYYRKNSHPGMFSYVASPGLPTDPVAHALGAALNQNLTGYASAPGGIQVEQTVIGWLTELAGLPDTADGLVVSGGSMAILAALTTAIYSRLGQQVREHGLACGPRPVVLAADSVHFSVLRAAVMLGLGREGVRQVAQDTDRRMDPDALEHELQQLAGESGSQACCVVATAGTTALGVIDPLTEIADVCRRHGAWLHVDAAYGGAALLAPGLRTHLAGIELADSINIDLHKWCYLSFDGGVLLYRDGALARQVYAIEADYVLEERNTAPEARTCYDLSPEVSRRNRALPAYLAWRHYGIDCLGRNVQHNADCARYLAQLVERHPDFELVQMPQLSICCFRYAPAEVSGAGKVDRLNSAIVGELSGRGRFLLSPTRVDGRPVLRVCVCTHTTRAQHMDALLDDIAGIGQELALTDS